MTDRVNLKVDSTTRSRLSDVKRDGETWDGLLLRAAEALEGGDTGPVCSECGDAVQTWTTIDGAVVCLDCADIDREDALP